MLLAIVSSINVSASWETFWQTSEIDFNTYPWIGKIGKPNEKSGCTASLLSPFVVLTAAHCVSREPSKLFLSPVFIPQTNKSIKHDLDEQVTFYLQYNNGSYLEKVNGKVVAIGDYLHAFNKIIRYTEDGLIDMYSLKEAQIEAFKSKNDWAIIVLDEMSAYEGSFPRLKLTTSKKSFSTDTRLYSLGYPGEIKNGEQAVTSKRCKMVEFIDNHIEVESCYMAHGMSGGPAVIRDGDDIILAGINSSGGSKYVIAPKRMASLNIPADILRILLKDRSYDEIEMTIDKLEESENQFLVSNLETLD